MAPIGATSIIIPFSLLFCHKKLRLLFNEKERFPSGSPLLFVRCKAHICYVFVPSIKFLMISIPAAIFFNCGSSLLI